MSTYRQILYQVIFATKNREETIPETHCTDLYKYIWGVIDNKKCKLHRINGVSDHIHIAIDLHPTIALASLVKDIKLSSSDWMKEKTEFELFNG
jgi:putative transposase